MDAFVYLGGNDIQSIKVGGLIHADFQSAEILAISGHSSLNHTVLAQLLTELSCTPGIYVIMSKPSGLLRKHRRRGGHGSERPQYCQRMS